MAVDRTAVPNADAYITENESFAIEDRPVGTTTNAVQSGWEAAEKLSGSAGDFPIEMKLGEDFQVIKFLDPDGPFATYKQHFLQQKTVGRRSYMDQPTR
jgi:hypothetical protein